LWIADWKLGIDCGLGDWGILDLLLIGGLN
jgi:hypothetical protein